MGRKSNVVAPTLLIEQDSHATSPSTTPMRPTPLIGSWGDYEWGADYKAAVLAVAAEKVAPAASIAEPVATHMIPAYDEQCYAASAPVGFEDVEEPQEEEEDDGTITPLPHANTDAFDTSFQHASVVVETQCHMSTHSVGDYEPGWYTPEVSYMSQTQSYSEQPSAAPAYPASYGAAGYNPAPVATHAPYVQANVEQPRHFTNTPYLAPPQMPHRALHTAAQTSVAPPAAQPLRSYVPQQRAQLESVVVTAPHAQQPRHTASFHPHRAAAAAHIPAAQQHSTTNYHNRRALPSAPVQDGASNSPLPPATRLAGPQLSFAPTQPGEISKFAPPPPPGPETDATFTRNGSPDDAFYTIVMRWYDKVVISQSANGFPPCPPAEQYLHDFPGWLDEVAKWWKSNFANRKGRPRGNGAMSHAHHGAH